VVKVPFPLHGDQTVFLLGARAMDHGGALYVDFWDTKQPGVFGFYWLAGRLFGFDAVGVHLLELIWLLVLSALMIRALRPYLAFPAFASAAPLFTVGAYYAAAGTWELSQIEMLSALPLFVSMWLVVPGYVSGAERMVSGAAVSNAKLRIAWFGSGLAAGLAVLFKLLLAPIPLAMWIAASVVAARFGHERWSAIVRERWIPALLGVIVVLGAVAIVLATTGALPEFVWTAFVYPLQAVAGNAHVHPERLRDSAIWFMRFFGPFVLLWLLSRVSWRGAAFERVFVFTTVWLCTAAVIILAQTLSWWRYHFLLLVVPLGLLAVRGLDGVMTESQRRVKWGGATSLIVGFVLVAAACTSGWRAWAADAAAVARGLEGSQGKDVVALQREVSPAWNRIWTDTAFLREPGSRPGPIYAFGDPRAIDLAGRAQAIPINGWSWESYARRQWDALQVQLERGMPVYIGIEPQYEALVRKHSPSTWDWIQTHYRVIRASDERTWFERGDVAPS
jgi:uncharacterized membrane protein